MEEILKTAIFGYLSEGFKIKINENAGFVDGISGEIYTVEYVSKNRKGEYIYHCEEIQQPFLWYEATPLLYNINCLTKPIVVKGYNDGKPFVPIEEIKTNYRLDILTGVYSDGSKCLWNEKTQSSSYRYWEYAIIEKLNSWKIDYKNLIGQGLAIDVETLKENCYE